MPVLRVLLMVLALLGVGIIAGTVSGVLWYVVAHASGTLPSFSAFLIPALIAFGVLFGWLLGRSPVYPGARTLAVVCVLFIPLRVLIAAVTEDTDVGAALFNSIVFAGVLYATARLTRPRQTGETHSPDEAI
jgi:hypothetical protein